MKKLTLFAIALAGALVFAQGAADPWAGTWKFDAAKSKLHGPPPKEEVVTSQGTGPGHDLVKYNIRGTAADGTAIDESFDGKSDGQPYPFMAGGQEAAKITYHRDSVNQYSSHGISSDGTTTVGTVTLSKDGKTITVQEHVKGNQGEFDQTIVYNKQ
jgi:hypothetical protein